MVAIVPGARRRHRLASVILSATVFVVGGASRAGACTLPSPMPEVLSFQPLSGVDLDSGWTGIAHDIRGVDDAPSAAARLVGCDVDASSATCGQCDLAGPIQFPGPSKNCRCYDLANRDASSLAACDPQASACTAPETCECFYGPPLPISSGAVPVCVLNRYAGPLVGTANIADDGTHSGEGAAFLHLESAVHNGLTVDQPCPTCEGDPTPRDGITGGTCNGGARSGQPCDVAGTNTFFGGMSFECPPAVAANIGNLDLRLAPGTTGTATLTTDRPCTGTTGACFCSTCATAAAEACNTNADCPTGVVCGGKRCIGGSSNGTPCSGSSECPNGGLCNRPGNPTARNQCADGVCSANPSDVDNAHEGICDAGPIDTVCSLETFRGCTSDSECNPPPDGSCASCGPGQTCNGQLRQCFLDPIVRDGAPGTEHAVLAATFCIPPTRSTSVNQVAGLPGPGAVVQPTRIFRLTSGCGNGVLDAGEACDPPADQTCPGACQLDCRCPGAATCGDGQVNQASEQCDGADDAACPGACQPDCTCGPVCGDGAVNQASEQCDGSDDAACPGQCQPTCLCPGCGDGRVNQASEQCDGGDDAACPAACQPDCTCGPFCGDGQVNQPGEQCDGADAGTCRGGCNPDCTCAPFCGNGVREPGELCDGGDDALCPGACLSGCTCPTSGEVTFVITPGADLDTGWTGTSHDFGVQAGTTLSGELSACDAVNDFDCNFFADVGSSCGGDPQRACLQDTQCAVGDSCVLSTYGPPLPLSSGGVPVCIVNRFASDVDGTYELTTGAAAVRIPLNSLVHLATDVSRPCPLCDCGAADLHTCQVGARGSCSDNPLTACTVQGNGPFGPTSNDCPPNPATNVSGNGLDIVFAPATTGTMSFASNQPCTGAGHQNEGCWCDGQTQANACLAACDGGSNDGQACASDAECPGAPAGACKPLCRQIAGEAVGEGACPGGPVDRQCKSAAQIGCSSDADCPAGLGPCVSENRRCFLDPIVREGVGGTTSDVLVATFCIPATSSPAVNNTAGLPGPGTVRAPNSVVAVLCGDGVVNRPGEECDGADDANCPGHCRPDCICATACGNGVVELGEQCDPGGPGGTPPPSDSACPALCTAAGQPNECTCPPLCGDGFVGPGEACDPGGPGGTPPPDDAVCPGACVAATCQCAPAVCGNGKLEPGEACELPKVGCTSLQVCLGCVACVP